MLVKPNFNAGFIILNEVVTAGRIARQQLTEDVAGDVLHVVLTKAEEIATDPAGPAQNSAFEVKDLTGYDPENLSQSEKRALVVTGTYILVSAAFSVAAQKIQQQKVSQLAKYNAPSDGGFERTFQEFRAATNILEVANAFQKLMANLDPDKLGEPNPKNIGRYVASVFDRHSPKL